MKKRTYRLRKFLLIGALILAVAALIACATLSAATAANLPATSTIAVGSLLGSKQSGDLSIQLFSASNPPIRGLNTIEALVASGGRPLPDAKVSFDVDMTNMSHGKNIIPASSLGKGSYTGQLFFGMSGPWRIIVNVERAGQTNSVRFDFNVNFR